MAKLEYLILHCSATPEGRDVKAETIAGWHTDPKPSGRGWSRPGYSQVVELDGSVKTLFDFDNDEWVDSGEITNGARGFNSKSRHFCYVGGLSKDGKSARDTRTKEQLKTLEILVKHFILIHPDIKVAGHSQFSSKACPSFDVPRWLETIGVDDKNIYRP